MEPVKSDSSSPVATPFCGLLRSKKYFMLNVIPTQAEDYLDASGHCWCYDTQSVRGPDEGFVSTERCVPGRSCYRSAFEMGAKKSPAR